MEFTKALISFDHVNQMNFHIAYRKNIIVLFFSTGKKYIGKLLCPMCHLDQTIVIDQILPQKTLLHSQDL